MDHFYSAFSFVSPFLLLISIQSILYINAKNDFSKSAALVIHFSILTKQNKIIFFIYHNLPNTEHPTVLTILFMLLSPIGLHIYYSPTKLTLSVYPGTPNPFLISFSCLCPPWSDITPLLSLDFIPWRWVVSPFGEVVAVFCVLLKLSVCIIVPCVHDSLPLKRKVLDRLFNHVVFYSETHHHHWIFFLDQPLVLRVCYCFRTR